MNQMVLMIPIDHKAIAQLLKKMCEEPAPKHSWPCINKMMHNIRWVIKCEPEMILNGKVSKCDVVAESILELPIINTPLECIIVEIECGNTSDSGTDSDTNADFVEGTTANTVPANTVPANIVSAYYGFVCMCEKKIVSATLSCYLFIDWLNDQDVNPGLITDIYVAGFANGVAHIKIKL